VKKRITVLFAAAFVLGVTLFPVGSAQASHPTPWNHPPGWRSDFWCKGALIQPGKACTSWPLNINNMIISWCAGTPPYNCGRRGDGSVLVGLTQYGGSRNGQPLAGVPGWVAWPAGYGDGILAWSLDRFNPYLANSYRYGQARIVNLSTVPIRIWSDGSYDWVMHYAP
jgi:hypothetical protein